MGHDNDTVCYYRYLDGDETGLGELIERYGDSLTFYISSYLHDLTESEDLMLEAFSRLLVKPRRFSEKTDSFKAYLFKIGHNLALRYLKKHQLRCCFSLDDIENEIISRDTIENLLLTNEKNQSLYKAMNSLNQQYREALYLIYFENMSYAAAAGVMRKTEKQIENLVYRGRHSLKNILEKEGTVNAKY